MLKLLLAWILAAQVSAPLPPYRRLDTLQIGKDHYTRVYTVHGNRFFGASGFYEASDDRCVAVDLKTMKRLWVASAAKGQVIAHIAVYRDTVYLTTHSFWTPTDKIAAGGHEPGQREDSVEAGR